MKSPSWPCVILCLLAYLATLVDCAPNANEITLTRPTSSPAPNGCKCENYNCGCCAHMQVKKIDLNGTLCSNFIYLVDDYGVSFTITWNDYTVYNETISARNPPPICFGSPFFKEWVEVCLRFEDVDVSPHSFSGCLEAEAEFKGVVVSKYKLGCFHMGHPPQELISVVVI